MIKPWLTSPAEQEAAGRNGAQQGRGWLGDAVLEDVADLVKANGFASLSLSKAVSKILSETGGALKPKQVVSAMAARGYPDESGTPLATRVRTQMWRMAERGQLNKTGRGVYEWPEV